MATDLTILLTLKGRTAYTYRWLEYMDRVKCPYPILISDGGDVDKGLEAHLADRNNYPNLEYEYIRFPYDADFLRYYNKVLVSLERIKTKYLLFADNDDLLLIDEIEGHLKFLSACPEYSASGGVVLRMYNRKDKVRHRNDLLRGNSLFFNERPRCKTLDSDDRAQRVALALKHYNGDYWYHINKVEPLRRAFEDVVRHSYERADFMEFSCVLSVAAQGKVRSDGRAFLVRQMGTSDLAGDIGREGGEVLMTMLLPFWSRNVTAFIDFASLVADRSGDGEYEWGLRESLAALYRRWRAATLQRPPLYKRLAIRWGLDDTRGWRAMRDTIILLKRKYLKTDPFQLQRLGNRKLVREHSGLQGVIDFMSASAEKPDARR